MVANVESARHNSSGTHPQRTDTGGSSDEAIVVQKLLCCLLGFDETALRTLRGLARLFRPSLTADWEFTEGWQDGCIILLCNLDDPSTRDLWEGGSLSDLPLAFATSANELPVGWVLRKPLRGQGPNGLVHILNEAATGTPPPRSEPVPQAATPAPPPEPEIPRSTIVPFRPATGTVFNHGVGQGWTPVPNLLRPEPSVTLAAGLPALAKAPQQDDPGGAVLPAAVGETLPVGMAEPSSEAAPAEPEPAEPLRAIAPPEAPPAAAEPIQALPETALAPEAPAAVEPPAQPATDDRLLAPPAAEEPVPGLTPPPGQLRGITLTEDAPPPTNVSDALTAALNPTSFLPQAAADVAPAAEGMQVNVVPVSDLPSTYGTARHNVAQTEDRKADEESVLRDRLRNLHAQPDPVAETQQDDFLALLNRLHRVRSVGILHIDGLPPFCVVPTEGAYYGRVTLAEIADRLRENNVPREVRLPPTLYEAMGELDARGLPPGQLRELFWLGNLHCPNAEQIARFEQGAYRLRRWPDLTQLPHDRQHVTWCGLVARRPVTLQALANVTNAAKQDLAAFLAACAALAILEQVEVTAEAQAGAPVQQTAKSKERTSIFRNLLNRLGFSRS